MSDEDRYQRLFTHAEELLRRALAAEAERDRMQPVVNTARRYIEADDAIRAHNEENEEHARLYGVWNERCEALRAAVKTLDSRDGAAGG